MILHYEKSCYKFWFRIYLNVVLEMVKFNLIIKVKGF